MSTSADYQDFKLDVRILNGADSDLVDIARQYWDLRGLDETGTYPMWRARVREIDTNGRGGRLHLLAVAASRAVVKGYFCASCEEELALPNRSALTQVLSSETDVLCVDCRPALLEEAEQFRNPDEWAVRQAQRRQERKSANEAYAEAEEHWNRSLRTVLQQTFPLRHRAEEPLPQLTARQELSALALLRHACSKGIISVQEHLALSPLAPNGMDWKELETLVDDGLLDLHPSTPVDSMGWKIKKFTEAYTQADGVLESLPEPELTFAYRPESAWFYVPFGHDSQESVRLADRELVRRLTHALDDHQRFTELQVLVASVIAEEGVRYFEHKLAEHHLPLVPEEGRPRLEEAAAKLGRVRCLGQVYFAAWSAVSSAAAFARRKPHAPPAVMTEQGLRRFEALAQRMVQDRTEYTKIFEEASNFPLSAMTRSLFHTVLNMNPMEANLSQVRQKGGLTQPKSAQRLATALPPKKSVAKPEPAPEPELVHPALDEKEFPSVELQARHLVAESGSWSPRDFAAAFQAVHEDISLVWDADHPSHSTLQSAAGALEVHLLQLSPYLEEREAVLATVLAAGLYRDLIGARPNALPAGRVVVGLLVEALNRKGRPQSPTEEVEPSNGDQ
ncbi:hypothetical protein ACIQFP_11990 [Nocardiopsis alba]|uniref:hypothetical protein n=1 Tax=Nocardiopsis alba TaxID=53437 RepID=UPI003805BF77